MAGLLTAYGYRMTQDKEEADVLLLNSCTVKNPSQDHFQNMVNEGKSGSKPVVAAGCVPQGQPNLGGLDKVSVLGVQQIDRVVEVVEEALKGNVVRLLGQRTTPSLDLPKIRRNARVEIVPINSGCLNSCTYCKTKHARGKLSSYAPDLLVARIQSVIAEGVCEVWLTSEDTGAYGRDIDTDIVKLLWAIVAVLPEHVMLRVGMTNPPYILEHLENLVPILNHPRVYAYLHIPVQAGSDAVLEAMKREYTCAEFEHIVGFLRTRVPDMTIATDIIAAFPTETEQDFQLTMDMINRQQFAIMNFTQFYPRPGTPAAKMKRVMSTREARKRTKAISEVFEAWAPYTKLVGRTVRVWTTGEMARDKKHMIGHTKNYTQVLIPCDDTLFGASMEVCITGAGRWSVFGTIVPGTAVCAP